MQLKEICAQTGLTRKAVEYYIQGGLISPKIEENGYRSFTKEEETTLSRIALFRGLGLGVEEIRSILQGDRGTLQRAATERALLLKREDLRLELLQRLAAGAQEAEIFAGLCALRQSQTIGEKLMEAFPGHYGSLLALHFSHFLNQPTGENQAAYDEVLEILDTLPPLDMPKALADYVEEAARELPPQMLQSLNEQKIEAIASPEQFLENNDQLLEEYLAFKETDEYKALPMVQAGEYFKAFCNQSGYYDRFLPALRRLSPAYDEYSCQMETANQVFVKRFPQVEEKK